MTEILSQAYSTLNELLRAFELLDYQVDGQPQFEDRAATTVWLSFNGKHTSIEVLKLDGYYYRKLDARYARYVTVDPFNRVYSVHSSLDKIPAKTLAMIRYKDWKYMEQHHASIPNRIYLMWNKSKYKVGDTIKTTPAAGFIKIHDITDCAKFAYSRREE